MITFEVFHPERILSGSNTPKLMSWVNDCLETGNNHLLIDFQYVSFMDSTGLGALIAVLKQVQKAKGTLALCSLKGQARMVMEISNTDQLFAIYNNQTEFYQAMEKLELMSDLTEFSSNYPESKKP